MPAQAQVLKTDLLIIGGGASGTTAGIQAARMGVQVLLVEETPWLGGMLTAAGVSAIDGNHQMPSGLWGEFRQKLYAHYGGPAAVETGWVSNTLFEPSVGNRLWKELATLPGLQIRYNTRWSAIEKMANGSWRVTLLEGRKRRIIEARLLLDASELGDVAAAAGAAYRIGMDSRESTGEQLAPLQANDIIQDLTYVVVLKDYGPGVNKTIAKPKGYNPEEFRCACQPSAAKKPSDDCLQMMQYGRLPNQKYMINWPRCGNDYYLNLIEKTPSQRQALLEEAKQHSLRFVYYLQQELGFQHLGLADDEFPTRDKLPMIPYHRESRRIEGLATLTATHVADPYSQKEALYRTGVAVGDYPIDHHHDKNPDAPDIDFINFKVPSYNIPLGALIPKGVEGLIVAEKSISVTNIVNGASRLQPVVMGIGQAAGALAALSLQKQVQPAQVPIREVQQALLEAGAYIMPFIDVKPQDPHFAALQRIGATGILKGTGISYKWANQTWMYPSYPISEWELIQGMQDYYPALAGRAASGAQLSLGYLAEVFKLVKPSLQEQELAEAWQQLGFSEAAAKEPLLNRRQAAVLIDRILNPFALAVDHQGQRLNNSSP
ncbi:FAD-dependent oxidoreductase [Cesiribacter andamanensis]|uniref:FAD-dependent oxidoreductase n=1 Tax=Cesiribacter andamanensis TaxID=649507 RepID=UPI001F235139|nr:FAD-dependent oxidoreductase [Cesiribacter andamanensis]